MQQQFKKSCVQYIFGLAWSDQHLDPVERDFLAALIDRSELEKDDYLEVITWLDNPPPEPNWALLEHKPDIARDVLKQAMLLSMLDMSVSLEETAFLEALRDRIGMSQQEFWQVQAEVEKVIASQLT